MCLFGDNCKTKKNIVSKADEETDGIVRSYIGQTTINRSNVKQVGTIFIKYS